ncbi:Bug family tripartite tricarboxylate transporter substrate binding protein [Sabulicella glaciei]|uniref:Tripartite tricarboxylate transporter substrate binding protein n=1 Tax=Sabulicella glaciei TaxID=2984948 RepID=A0ABT3NV27_9PROT|nr:tripartite tricarboxylate transporter substrate binding protein [Roseococcus sp. MDT2-1-1]MCW8086022.1 tripartite tricarboxylate transporter substrate binding protein [Roseococcus sp. MDT2-1-1]
MPTRRLLLAAALAAPAIAQAQGSDWPQRSIRLISPFPPGGAADLLARVLAEELSPVLRQTVVVENRTGAGGSVGTEAAVRATPDGYTLVMGSTGPISINPSLFRLSYDPARDLVPVAPLASVASVLVVHPAVPARNLGELMAMARARPGELSYGSSGIGSAQHLFTELLLQQTGLNINHIPYRGTGPAMVDTVGGRLTMMFDTTPTALPHIRDGRVRPLAVTAARRDPALPDVPTIAEAGVPGYEALGWYGLFAPAATPRPVVERLAQEVNALLGRAEFRAKLEAQGVEPMSRSVEEFSRFVAQDRTRWGEVIQRGNIRPDG